MDSLSVIILAAGKGTRMRSDLAKVLHSINNRAMIHYVVDLAEELQAERTIVVVGHQADAVQAELAGRGRLSFALQQPQLGTGHAVMAAAPGLEGFSGQVLVLYGDVPGLSAATCRSLVEANAQQGQAMTVLAMELADPGAYGRLVADEAGNLVRIVEARDATEGERGIKLVNSGIYCFQAAPLLAGLGQLKPDNDQAEYYLTDLVEILVRQGLRVGYDVCPDPEEVAGINSVDQLHAFEQNRAAAASGRKD